MTEAKPRTVLVVDDDPDILSIVSFVLRDEGYDVMLARDGREGLEAAEQEMPDLILLDLKMPMMNGWEFAREFRARYDCKVPIVVLTAADDAKRRAQEIGAVGWIGKPFDLNSLVSAVDEYLSL